MGLLDFLFPPREDERIVRELSQEFILERLSPRSVTETRPETVVLLTFSDPSVRALIHEAKYHGNEKAFSLLSLALTEYLRDSDDVGRHACLVPVPLGAKRRKERGYNQVEEVAIRSARELGFTLDSTLLKRTRETPTQVSLSRDKREENMQGAFLAEQRLDPELTYIVVDDVLTTGATLQAAVDALLKAGARHVVPLALAH